MSDEIIPQKGDKEQIVMALVKMRVEKYASQKTMYEFLTKQLGYKQAYAYELLDVARKRIVEIFKEEHEEAFQAAVSQLQEMIETAKDYRIRLEARKELNKLLGLHRPQRIEVSGQIDHNIRKIEVEIVNPNVIDITPTEVKSIEGNE
jgi:plasmid maintenance system antidote protein VapI